MGRTKPGELTYQRSDGSEYRMELRADVTTLGRSDTCTVIIPLPTVSRLHARIELHGDFYILFDNGSANGTLINGTPIETGHPLHSGDVICLGSNDVCLQFMDPEETIPVVGKEKPGLAINENSHSVEIYGVPVQLSPIEYKLLLYLANNHETVCSRESCFSAAWGYSQPYTKSDADAFNASVAKLRQSLRAAAQQVGQEPPDIKTVRGFGIRLDINVTRVSARSDTSPPTHSE